MIGQQIGHLLLDGAGGRVAEGIQHHRPAVGGDGVAELGGAAALEDLQPAGVDRGLRYAAVHRDLLVAVLIRCIAEGTGVAGVLDDAGGQVIAAPVEDGAVAVGHVAIGIITIAPVHGTGDGGHGMGARGAAIGIGTVVGTGLDVPYRVIGIADRCLGATAIVHGRLQEPIVQVIAERLAQGVHAVDRGIRRAGVEIADGIPLVLQVLIGGTGRGTALGALDAIQVAGGRVIPEMGIEVGPINRISRLTVGIHAVFIHRFGSAATADSLVHLPVDAVRVVAIRQLREIAVAGVEVLHGEVRHG